MRAQGSPLAFPVRAGLMYCFVNAAGNHICHLVVVWQALSQGSCKPIPSKDSVCALQLSYPPRLLESPVCPKQNGSMRRFLIPSSTSLSEYILIWFYGYGRVCRFFTIEFESSLMIKENMIVKSMDLPNNWRSCACIRQEYIIYKISRWEKNSRRYH